MIESQLPEIKHYRISSGKLRRYISLENAKDVFKVLKGNSYARKVLKKEKPDLLFSKSGFVYCACCYCSQIIKYTNYYS